MNKITLTIVAILLVLTSYADDLLTLNNCMVFKGKITKIKCCTVAFKANGQNFLVPVSEIFALEFENAKDKVYIEYMNLADGDPDKCMSGILDAGIYHGKKGSHFVLGFLFGPFAMIGTALSNPIPERGKFAYLSKNKEMFRDTEYLSCYKQKATRQLIGMEALGWCAWILAIITIMHPR